jgi:hypothetical protein
MWNTSMHKEMFSHVRDLATRERLLNCPFREPAQRRIITERQDSNIHAFTSEQIGRECMCRHAGPAGLRHVANSTRAGASAPLHTVR